MKIHNKKMNASVLTYVMQGALAAMLTMPLAATHAEDAIDEVAQMRKPTSTIEAGALGTSQKSTKFGEYNGIVTGEKLNPIGNFNVRGGNAYDSKDGTRRWEVSGKNLGTTSSEFTGSISNQGKWTFDIGYDDLTHYTTNNYQTPFVEGMGGNSFTLPANFGVIYAASSTLAVGQACNPATVPNCVNGLVTPYSSRTLSAAQLAAMNAVDVGQTNQKTSFNAGFNLDREWSAQIGFSHLKQTGAKLIGSGSTASGVGATNTIAPIFANTNAASQWTREANMILMNPTNYVTENLNLLINWVGEKAHLHAAYTGSLFHDENRGLYWQSPFINATSNVAATALPGNFITNVMSTPPSNENHQLSLNGGYDLKPTTKLVGGLSYGVNTQNEAFLVDPTLLITQAPSRTSLNGRVATTHADLKLTDRSIQNLSLSAGLKYNERNNTSPSMRMAFQDIRGNNQAPVQVVNTPYSNRSTLLDLGAEYKLSKTQSVRAGFEHEKVKRWCNNVLPTITAASGIGGPGTMAVGTVPGCVLTPSSIDNKIGLTYKLNLRDDFNLIADLSHAKRTTINDPFFVNPLGGTGQVGATTALVLGNGTSNAGNYYGFKTYFDAARRQNLLKLRANWAATDALSFTLTGRYENNKYDDSPLGVQDGRNVSLNLDTTYIYSEKGSFSAYASKSDRRRINKSLGATGTLATGTQVSASWGLPGDPVGAYNVFVNELIENSVAMGFNLKHQMNEAWVLAGDLSYSLDKSGYKNTLTYPLATNAGCDLTNVLTCGSTPVIRSETTTLNLTADYKVDKARKVKMAYTFQRLDSEDYYYNPYQYGYTSNATMPTNQQAPSYTQHALAVFYIYSFK